MLCVVLSGCGDRTAFREAVGQAGGTGGYGIEWYAGSVDSAFELARSQGTPVLLYWGADWCPPCNTLKAEVFNRREFIERSRLFVPVNLDGDDPGAQKLGERFGVYAYPNLIVLSPHGEEVTRIAGGLYLDQYLEAMDIALAATRPVAAAYDAASHGYATAADYRLLAYYSWAQDRERLVPKENLPDTLRNLHGRIPDELAVERALVFIHYLNAYGSEESEQDREPTLPAEERPADGRTGMDDRDPPGSRPRLGRTILRRVRSPLVAADDRAAGRRRPDGSGERVGSRDHPCPQSHWDIPGRSRRHVLWRDLPCESPAAGGCAVAITREKGTRSRVARCAKHR